MKQKARYSLIFILVILLISCATESEKILTKNIESEDFNFTKFKDNFNNISYNIKDNIQYGLIHLENGEDVKFWFLTHHVTSDMGGTFYEFPDGKKEFYSGLHCCEVQFYENGKLGKKFKDASELRNFLIENDGLQP